MFRKVRMPVGIEDINASDLSRLYSSDRNELLQPLLKQLETWDEYAKQCCYHPELLRLHLQHATFMTDLDDVTQTVARCIEHNLFESLQLVLAHLDTLIELYRRFERVDLQYIPQIWHSTLSEKKGNQKSIRPLDRELHLRRVGSVRCYLAAREHGFVDHLWEHRISQFQRRFRKQRIATQKHESFRCATTECSAANTMNTPPLPWKTWGDRCWGYRHTYHWLRWNRRHAYKVLCEILSGKWRGDCRSSAYIDIVEGAEREDAFYEIVFSMPITASHSSLLLVDAEYTTDT